MRAVDYLQINLIPIIGLIIMRINSHKTLSYTWRNHALRFMIVLLAGILSVDLAAWLLDGQQFYGAGVLVWAVNMLYFAVMEFAAFLWFLYVKDVVNGENGQRGKIVVLPALPLILFGVLLISNPWSRLLFYVDEHNCYARGPWFLVHSILAAGYILAATALALVSCKKTVSRETKKQYRLLASFAVLPLFGGIAQICRFGTSLLWPFTAASLVMVYINAQWEQVTRDGLTGLNNRRRLDQYLESLEPWQEERERWYLLLLDVDKFKKINDTYGHVAGDHVLKLVAAQLKKSFGDSRAFLARYGGDEFVVIMRCPSEEKALKYTAEIKKAISGMDWAHKDAWKIEVSVGCAAYDKTTMRGTGEWFALADERMYQEKKHKC